MPTSDPREIPAAYPEDWIATLDGRSYLTKVYDRNGFLLYSVDVDRMPEEWKRLARPGDAPRLEPAPGVPE